MGKKEPQIDLLKPSEIENVDYAFYDWLDKQLNLFCTTKDGFNKVPVIWVTPERAFQIKESKELRDIDGTLNLPLITIERTSIVADQKNAATFYANIPPKDERFSIARRINQKKTSEFANAYNKRQYGNSGFVSPKKNQRIVYEFREMLMPVYATFTYNISLFTQFQQQMNEILQPFITITGSRKYFLIERDGYKYECFIESNINTKNNINSMNEEERRYISEINIKVLANLIGQSVNQEDKIVKSYENAVELKLNKDILIIQETIPRKQQPTPLVLNNFGSQISTTIPIKKTFSIGNGVDSVYVVTHNLNTRDMFIVIRESAAPYSVIISSITHTDLNNISIDLGIVAAVDSYMVTVIG